MTSGRNRVIHSPEEIAGIRRAALAAAAVRDRLRGMIRPGMTTLELDHLAAAMIAEAGGRSAFLGYHGFPGQICVSLNDEVVHGIGHHARIIAAGDLVSVDVGIDLGGFIGDTAITVAVPPVAPEAERLIARTEAALAAGIAAARAGNRVGDISAAVERVAKKAGLGIVRDYVGHGCGLELHEPPEVPNFRSSDSGPRLVSGMVLCVEPMLNLGTSRVFTDIDRWTVRTKDARLSAHCEHMVLITDSEPEVLTWRKM